MTLLPIVDRELRLASRKKSTYWVRTVAASLWFLVTGGYLLILMLARKMGASGMTGHYVFVVLTWMAFLGLALSGVFLTSDTLSEEKREGTLGLLFLTDLRGYDVVFGKSTATVLQALYGLLAVVPLFSLPVLFGGVTGEDFWKTMLMLVNTLFFSLAAGILVSSISVNAQRAATATLLLLIVCFALPTTIGRVTHGAISVISVLSPVTPLLEAQSNSYTMFWQSILASHVLAWVFLIVASFVSPRNWRRVGEANDSHSLGRRFRFGGAKRRDRWRSATLDSEPMLWLAARERWQGAYFKIVFFAGVGLFLVLLSIDFKGAMNMVGTVVTGFTWVLGFLVELWIATQACQFFLDGMHSGALELLLCAPLDSASIIKGQWKALQRSFRFPLLLLVLLQVVSLLVAMQTQAAALAALPAIDWKFYTILNSMMSVITLLGNCAGLAWFGMWMGMTTKKTALAVLKTYGFLITLPAVAISMSQGFVVFFLILVPFKGKAGFSPTSISTMMMIVPPIVTCLLTLIKNIVFISISRRKLFGGFRQMAAGEIIRRSLAPVFNANIPPIPATK